MNENLSNDTIKSRITGALYGFAIGDAMGATTEFMTKQQIKAQYGYVDNIIGGGWLNLKAGEVTDDTQMTICVMNAFMNSWDDNHFQEECMSNFIEWYKMGPKDIGNQCRKGITYAMSTGHFIERDNSALGNGSLMRALPCALLGKIDLNIMQGNLTHPSDLCIEAIKLYHKTINNIIYNIYNENYRCIPYTEKLIKLMEPTGYIINTLNNAMFWANKDSFESCIVGAVNHGGDADTIAAIAGSISGARFGIESIPERWIEQLSPTVKKDLEKFKNFVFSYVQI